MTRRALACLTLVLICAAGACGAAKRKIVPVPTWAASAGKQWGELELGVTTRAAFERGYSSDDTPLTGVLHGNTANRTDTELFLAFDGPGPDARLAWIALFYDGKRGAPSPVEFEGRYGGGAVGGYPPERRADWRLRVTAAEGIAAVVERDEERERVAGLLVAPPERLATLARRLSVRETEIASPLRSEDLEPLVVRIAIVDADADVDRDVSVDRRRLRRELERAAEDAARTRSDVRLGGTAGGRLAVAVDVERRERKEKDQIRLTARATLDGQGPYGIVSTRSGDLTRDLDAGDGQSRITREARRLVEQAVGSVASSAHSQLQERRTKAPRLPAASPASPSSPS